MNNHQKKYCPVRWGFFIWLGLFCFFLQAGLTTLAWAGPIQDLINAALDGATVTVPAGNFNENLNVDKNLTLQGISSAASILQPGAAGQRVITVSANRNLTLRNLKVTGGQATGAGGGGVYLAGGSLTLIGAHITNNSADYGGGIFQEGGSGRLEATNSLIEGNTATFHGGGMYARGNAILTNTQVTSNTAGSHGGGIYVNIEQRRDNRRDLQRQSRHKRQRGGNQRQQRADRNRHAVPRQHRRRQRRGDDPVEPDLPKYGNGFGYDNRDFFPE